MIQYHITFAPDAAEDFDHYLQWLEDEDAVISALMDFNEARDRLSKVAGRA